MITIALFNQKGGVSKTTSAANLSTIFAGKLKKRVLAIDCDAQANLSFYLTGNKDGDPGLYNAVKKYTGDELFKAISACTKKIKFTYNNKVESPPLYLIESSKELDYIETEDVNLLRDYFKTIENDYDICLLDCGPSKTTFNVLALAAVDYVLVPMDPQIASLNGLLMVKDFIERTNEISGSHAEILGAFLAMVDSRGVIHNMIREQFQSALGDKFLKTSIRRARAIEESYNFSTPVYYYERSQKVCKDYISLAKEILDKYEEQK